MKIFDSSLLKPKKIIPIVIISFMLLNFIGYLLALKSIAHEIATTAIAERFKNSGKIVSRISLLPWGFKVRSFDNDGDAHFNYYISLESGSERIEVNMLKTNGVWTVIKMNP